MWEDVFLRGEPLKLPLFPLRNEAAEQFIAEHQAEIAAHAQAHSMTALNHNRGIPEQVWEILKQRSAKVET